MVNQPIPMELTYYSLHRKNVLAIGIFGVKNTNGFWLSVHKISEQMSS